MRTIVLTHLFFSTLLAGGLLEDARASLPQTEEISSLFDELETHFRVIETGGDDLRIKYVQAQGCIEHMLSKKQSMGEISKLIGIIHTPLPATPLCVKPDQNTLSDDKKWETVLTRAQILSDYLQKGGILYIVYPEGGLERRTSNQQKIYAENLEQFPENLIDCTLSIAEIAPDMIGATYFFFDANNQPYAFSIKAHQISHMQPLAEWGIWFGPTSREEISTRIQAVIEYLTPLGGPSI